MSDNAQQPPEVEVRPCPDGGTCHHECNAGPCFRVRACGPLSGVFPNNRWPEEVKAAEAAREQ